MDIVIEPYHEDGFRIQWVNVTLVDGRRDLPGVVGCRGHQRHTGPTGRSPDDNPPVSHCFTRQ
jgi:hypothetical protein